MEDTNFSFHETSLHHELCVKLWELSSGYFLHHHTPLCFCSCCEMDCFTEIHPLNVHQGPSLSAFYLSIKRFKRFQCCYLGHVFRPLHTRKHRFVLIPGWIVSLSRFTGLLHSVSSGALTNVTAAVLTPTQRVSQELVSRGPAVTQTPSSLTQTMEMRKLNLYQMFIRVVERIDPRRQKLL